MKIKTFKLTPLKFDWNHEFKAPVDSNGHVWELLTYFRGGKQGSLGKDDRSTQLKIKTFKHYTIGSFDWNHEFKAPVDSNEGV